MYRKIVLSAIMIVLLVAGTQAMSAYAQHHHKQMSSASKGLVPTISEELKMFTVTGKDASGNNLTIEIFLARGSMMHPMMGMMHHMMAMMGNMTGMNMGMGGMGMNMTQQQMHQMMMEWMMNNYSVQGGSVTVGEKTYLIDFGNARVSDNKIFINAKVDGIRTGKIILYGTLDTDDGLKGRVLVWESYKSLSSTKIVGKGIIEDIL